MLSIAPPPISSLILRHNRRHHGGRRKLIAASSLPELDKIPTAVPFPTIKGSKRVVLVRHGQSTWNHEGRIQGSSDFSVLTKTGEAQAETNRKMLTDDSFDVCFASPLNRSKRTAEIIWDQRNAEILTDYDLREIDLYSFQGLLKHEGVEKFGAAFKKWQLDAPNFNIDGHYPVRELWARARSCWDKILEHESRSVLVVAHNAVNQALLATAMGLGTEYFRILVQSNCGVSVLDFTPSAEGGSPSICLNRLNQTPSSPLADGSSAGRKACKQIVLVCHGFTQSGTEAGAENSKDQPMNMLGNIQSQKTSEMLLDLKMSTVVSSPGNACVDTAISISRVQESADCLGADCVPRYVEMKQLKDLDVRGLFHQSNQDAGEAATMQPGFLSRLKDEALSELWDQAGRAWEILLNELSDEHEPEKNIVVVGHPGIHIALLGHCLNLTKDRMGSFHLDAGSISVLDFPDGPAGRGVVRCINYTAHLGRWSVPITTRPAIDDV